MCKGTNLTNQRKRSVGDFQKPRPMMDKAVESAAVDDLPWWGMKMLASTTHQFSSFIYTRSTFMNKIWMHWFTEQKEKLKKDN